MRLVVDALAAQRGGLATYVHGLLRAWSELAPADELTVLLTKPYADVIGSSHDCERHRLLVWPHRDPEPAWRLWRTQYPMTTLQTHADALLATMPTLPSLWRKPTAVVVQDLRHEERPFEFNAHQRLTRRIFYGSAFRRADRLITISQRTADDLCSRHPDTCARISVAHLGADHVSERQSTRQGAVIAFGHYANKEPGLLLQVWAHLLHLWGPRLVPQLRIVGLDDAQRTDLRRKAARLEISAHVQLDVYLDAESFDRVMSMASAVLLPSRYEGFGLPVLEAMRQGIPVVISQDRALQEVAGGHAAIAASWSPEDIADATMRALSLNGDDLELARQHAASFTWLRTASATRAAVQTAIASHTASRSRRLFFPRE
jgi:glycosyltransferase involved in cell wall biosynthesis